MTVFVGVSLPWWMLSLEAHERHWRSPKAAEYSGHSGAVTSASKRGGELLPADVGAAKSVARIAVVIIKVFMLVVLKNCYAPAYRKN